MHDPSPNLHDRRHPLQFRNGSFRGVGNVFQASHGLYSLSPGAFCSSKHYVLVV